MPHTVEKDWITEAGLRAVVLAVQFEPGVFHHRCGYVAVTPDHPFYGKSYSSIDAEIDVHGGLTFSSAACHENYPVDSSEDLWWFGFDCAHAFDRLEPKSLSYVICECEHLAKQLIDLNPTKSGEKDAR